MSDGPLPPRVPALHNLALHLALPEPSRATLALARQLPPPEVEQLLLYADDQRVLVPVGGLLAETLKPGLISAAQRIDIKRRIGLRDELHALMGKVAQDFARLGLRNAFLKGFNVERAYGREYRRQLYDLDLALPDLDTFWRAAVVLLLSGFQLNCIVLRRDQETGCLIGGATMIGPSIADPEFRRKVEFQIGGQPLHWASALPFNGEFWGELTQPFPDQPMAVPSARYAVLVLLGEALERVNLRIRDLLDLIMLARQLSSSDVLWLRQRIADLCLEHELLRFSACLQPAFRSHCPEVLLELFSAFDQKRRRWSGIRRRPLRLALFHDIPYGTRHFGWRKALLTMGANVTREMLMSLRKHDAASDVLAQLSRWLDSRRLVEAGAYVQLIPLAPTPRESLNWRRCGKDNLLITPLGIFLPVPLGVLNEQTLVQAQECAAAIAAPE